MNLKERVAEQCYWDYMGYDSKYHPTLLENASENMKQEMFNRSDRILNVIADDIERTNIHIPMYPDTRGIHFTDYIPYMKGAKDEHAYIVEYLRGLLDN